MIRLYDLNACEWRVYPSPDAVPMGNFRTENGMRWTSLAPEPASEPSTARAPDPPAAPKRAPKRAGKG